MPEKESKTSFYNQFKETWPKLNFFERFEYLISIIVMFLISIIVIVSLIRLGINVYSILVTKALDPLDFKVFQLIFGNILTLFIAMEFMHSIEGGLHKKGHIIEVRTILLIAILAISRKFIVMDTKATSPEAMTSLALILLSLGAVYWFIKIKNQDIIK
ncbi:MAG: phosphate-starvation-inducible PsiE family protein [Gammaproteobacteria bacterium]|nr:phosphate-starvation-inducible PsiE family protein [Gammaproteobacteria bacterium]